MAASARTLLACSTQSREGVRAHIVDDQVEKDEENVQHDSNHRLQAAHNALGVLQLHCQVGTLPAKHDAADMERNLVITCTHVRCNSSQ